MTYDHNATTMLFLAPPTTGQRPSELTSAARQAAGECSLNPFAVRPDAGSRPHRHDVATATR